MSVFSPFVSWSGADRRALFSIPLILLLSGLTSACSEDLIPPVASIEAPATAVVGSVIELDGSGSSASGGGSLSYSWAFVEVPPASEAELNDATLVNPSFTADIAGDYVVALVVRTSELPSAPTAATISVSICGAQAPVVAEVTTDPASVSSGTTVVLSSDVSDADNGEECGLEQRLSYTWAIVDKPVGSEAEINDPTLASPTFFADLSGTYEIELVAMDSEGLASDVFELELVVSDCGEAAPVVDSLTASPSEPAMGELIRLEAAWSDGDNEPGCDAGQTVTFSWELVDRPVGSRTEIAGADLPEPNLLPDLLGDYTVALTVTDSTGRDSLPLELTISAGECGSIAPEVTAVEVSPAAPNTGELVDLTISVRDSDNDPELCGLAQLLSVSSEIVSRPSGSETVLVPADGLTLAFAPDLPGEYVVRSVVADDSGLFSAVDTYVTAADCGDAMPVVTAVTPTPASPGVSELVSFVVEVEDADTNPDGCALEQELVVISRLISQPAGSVAAMTPSLGLNPGLVVDVPGGYEIRTTVSDGTGRSSYLDTVLTATDCGTGVPEVTDVSVSPESPNTGETVYLTIVPDDADNRVDACNLNQALTLRSLFVVQPAGSITELIPARGPTISFHADVFGAYTVRTYAEDDTGLRSFVDTDIVVNECGSAAPTVSLSEDGGPFDTGDVVWLDVASADPDNSCLPESSRQTVRTSVELLSKPVDSSAKLVGETTDGPYFLGDLPGNYLLAVTADDGTGRRATNQLTVTVRDCGSATPTVDIALDGGPFNTGDVVELTVTPADADNSETCFAGDDEQDLITSAELLAAPVESRAALVGATTLNPFFLGDVPGDYILRVRVDDGTGRFGEDTLTVTVQECGSRPPEVVLSAVESTHNTGDTVILAVVTSDPDNAETCFTGDDEQALTHLVSLVSQPVGSAAVLIGGGTVAPYFLADVPGDYELAVTVEDGTGNTGTDTLSLEVEVCGSQAPTGSIAAAGDSAAPQPGDQVNFVVASNDPDNTCLAEDKQQTVSTLTTLIAVPAGSTASILAARTSAPYFIADETGFYEVEVAISDSTGLSVVARKIVEVGACGTYTPTFSSRPDASIATSTSRAVTLAFEVGDQDLSEACGPLAEVLSTTHAIITRPTGSTAVLSSSTGLETTLVPDAPGVYVVQSIVTDLAGHSATVETQVTAADCGSHAPTLSTHSFSSSRGAYPTASLYTFEQVTLTLTLADADIDDGCLPDQMALAHTELLGRPIGSSAAVLDGDTVTPRILPDRPGTYRFGIRVTDDTGLSSESEVSVVIDTCGSHRPEVTGDAGAAIESATGVPVALAFTATDDDDNGTGCTGIHEVLTIRSEIVGRPGGSFAQLDNTLGAEIGFTPDVQGVYVIQTVATDRTSQQSLPYVTSVTATGCGIQSPNTPAATVESPRGVYDASDTATHPYVGDIVSLALTATDPDNDEGCGLDQSLSFMTIVTTLPEGSAAWLRNPATAAPSLVADVSGTFGLTTTVTDDTGRSTELAYTIVVSSCGGQTPVLEEVIVSVGGTPLGALTVNTTDLVQLDITVTDPDDACVGLEEVLTVTSEIIEGPDASTATTVPSTGTSTNFLADQPGVFTVLVTASDQDGHTASQELVITAADCGSRAPTALMTIGEPIVAGPGNDVFAVILADVEIMDLGILRSNEGAIPLNGAASTDADDACLDAAPELEYEWRVVSAPARATVSFNNPFVERPTLFLDLMGDYEIELVVSDGFHTASATATIEWSLAPAVGAPDGYSVRFVAGGLQQPFDIPFSLALGPDDEKYTQQALSGDLVRTASPSVVVARGDTMLRNPFGLTYSPTNELLIASTWPFNPIEPSLFLEATMFSATGNLVFVDPATGERGYFSPGLEASVAFEFGYDDVFGFFPTGITEYFSTTANRSLVAVAAWLAAPDSETEEQAMFFLDARSGEVYDVASLAFGVDIVPGGIAVDAMSETFFVALGESIVMIDSDWELTTLASFNFQMAIEAGLLLLAEAGVLIPDLAYDADNGVLYAATIDALMVIDVCDTPGTCEVACLTNQEELPMMPVGVAIGADGTVFFTDLYLGGLWSISGDLEDAFSSDNCPEVPQ